MDPYIYQLLFEQSTIGLAVNRMSNGEFISVNQAFAEIVGYSLEELNELSYWDLPPSTYAQQEQQQLDSLNNTGRYGPYEKQYVNKDNKWIPVRLNGSKIISEASEAYILSSVEDISMMEQTKKQLSLASMVLENSSEGMMISDADNQILAVNPAFSEITGYAKEEVVGRSPEFLLSGKHSPQFYQELTQSLRLDGKWCGEIWEKDKNGHIYAKRTSINTIKDHSGEINRYVYVFSDITEQKQWQEILWNKANIDQVTGLANRHQLKNILHEELNKCIDNNDVFSLLLIDLDEFKDINDTFGHDVGDFLLSIIAKRLKANLRKNDFVARYGGDEFVILLRNLNDQGKIQTIAENLLSSLAMPYHFKSERLYLSASIGIVRHPCDGDDIKSMLKFADQAMYQAKKSGKNTFRFYTTELEQETLKRLRMTNDLMSAVNKQQLEVYYQPIIETSTNKIARLEALIRWQHETQGFISPIEFIPIAERIGIVTEIGSWVAEQSMKWLQLWDYIIEHDFKISINVSPTQFKPEYELFWNHWIANLIQKKLTDRFIIEITEDLLMTKDKRILSQFNQLRDLGIEVAIDDFGTGYSSLSYLKVFDVDYLKVDRTFIQHIESAPDHQALYEAIIAMAHKLDLKVVAEGVEEESQAEILRQLGCDYIQGFLYAKPMPPQELEQFFKQWYAS